MPSPVNALKFYRRKDGAWIKMRGHYRKVGAKAFQHLPHYSKRSIKKDRKRRATKAKRKLVRRYPQEYD